MHKRKHKKNATFVLLMFMLMHIKGSACLCLCLFHRVNQALARQPSISGMNFSCELCLYEKISSRLRGQFCCFDIVLTVVKIASGGVFELSSRQLG